MDESNHNQPRIRQISQCMVELLTEEIPSFRWTQTTKGFHFGENPMGTIAANRVSFEEFTKLGDMGHISFEVYMVVPSHGELDTETVAFKVREVLERGIEDGYFPEEVTKGTVKSITFGQAPGYSDEPPDAASLIFEVESYFD